MIGYTLQDKIQLKDFIVARTLRVISNNPKVNYKKLIVDEVKTHLVLSDTEIGYIAKASIKLVGNQLNIDETNQCST